jgi:hypothetical protein
MTISTKPPGFPGGLDGGNNGDIILFCARVSHRDAGPSRLPLPREWKERGDPVKMDVSGVAHRAVAHVRDTAPVSEPVGRHGVPSRPRSNTGDIILTSPQCDPGSPPRFIIETSGAEMMGESGRVMAVLFIGASVAACRHSRRLGCRAMDVANRATLSAERLCPSNPAPPPPSLTPTAARGPVPRRARRGRRRPWGWPWRRGA